MAMPAPQQMRRPSAATAITAGVLASIGGLLFAVFGVVSAGAAVDGSDGSVERRVFVILAVLGPTCIVVGLLLLVGALLLFLRKSVGRVLVIIGSACAFATVVAFALYSFFHGPVRYGRADVPILLILMLPAVPAAVTLVLAAITPTARYLKWRPAPPPFGQPPVPQLNRP